MNLRNYGLSAIVLALALNAQASTGASDSAPMAVPDELNVGKYDGPVTGEAFAERLALQEKRKAIVYNLFARCMTRRDFECLRPYLTSNYIQHDPEMEDGVEGMRKMVDKVKRTREGSHYRFLRIVAEGDYVVLHYSFGFPDGPKEVAFSIFRFEGDKLAEHWDAGMEVPTSMPHGNGVF